MIKNYSNEDFKENNQVKNEISSEIEESLFQLKDGEKDILLDQEIKLNEEVFVNNKENCAINFFEEDKTEAKNTFQIDEFKGILPNNLIIYNDDKSNTLSSKNIPIFFNNKENLMQKKEDPKIVPAKFKENDKINFFDNKGN